jgi:alkanesulfonate monooxygenase SsuD/methylene tetrahydromethanopterin reductase-like flavin-dependent oxidoreductase (luciferase family)
MLEIAAQYCDGVALHPLAGIRPYFDHITLPALERGAARAETDRNLAKALWYICSVHEDADVARLRAANVLAFYFSTPSYANPLEGTPWDAAGAKVRAAFRESRYPTPSEELARMIPEGMTEDICLTGTPKEVAQKIDVLESSLVGMGIDELVLEPTAFGGLSAFTESCKGIIAAAAGRQSWPDTMQRSAEMSGGISKEE